MVKDVSSCQPPKTVIQPFHVVLVLLALETGRKKYNTQFPMALSSFKINGHFFIRLYSVKSSFYRRVTGQILKNDQVLSTVFLRLFSSNEWSLGKKKKVEQKNVIPLFIVLLLGMLLLRDKLESIEFHSKSAKKICTLISRNSNESQTANSYS